MGDVAFILRGAAAPSRDALDSAFKGSRAGGRGQSNASSGAGGSRGAGAGKQQKPLSREVRNLFGSQSMAPIMPSKTAGGLSLPRKHTPAAAWKWAPFTSSARRDGTQFHHWVLASTEFVDYPFARFNKKVDVVRYTDEEYRQVLMDDAWPKEHTDRLFDLARRFDLRWPVIFDRLETSTPHSLTDIKARFYAVTARIIALRKGSPSVSTLRGFADFAYNSGQEEERRVQLDRAFNQTPQELDEEISLLKELSAIDAQLKKMKGQQGHQDVVAMMATKLDLEALEQVAEGAAPMGASPSAVASAVNPGYALGGAGYSSYLGAGAGVGLSVGPGVGTGAAGGFGAVAGTVGDPSSTTAVHPPRGTGLRSQLFSVPLDGVESTAKALQSKKIDFVLSELAVPTAPMAKLSVYKAHKQLKRDIQRMILLQKTVSQAEREVIELLERRERLANTPLQTAKALTVGAAAGAGASASTQPSTAAAAARKKRRSASRDEGSVGSAAAAPPPQISSAPSSYPAGYTASGSVPPSPGGGRQKKGKPKGVKGVKKGKVGKRAAPSGSSAATPSASQPTPTASASTRKQGPGTYKRQRSAEK